MSLQTKIEQAWDKRELLQQEEYQDAVREVVKELDLGKIRVAEPVEGGWKVNEWVKKAVVMYFPIQKMETIEVGDLGKKKGWKEIDCSDKKFISNNKFPKLDEPMNFDIQ